MRSALLLAAAVALCASPAGGASTSAVRPSAKAGKKEAEPPRESPAEGKQVRCLAIKAKGGALEPTRYAVAAVLEPKEVEIVVHACGLSRGDVALASEEDATFPLIPGREIIGHVVAAGSAVTSVRPGMRVGVGLQMGDVDGDALMSEAPVTVGGLADRVRVRSRWAFPVPDALPTEQAAPLFGAGAAAWSHLSRAKLKRGSKVAVVGLGGIGHLAVQFASRMGHAVTIVGTRRAARARESADARQRPSRAARGCRRAPHAYPRWPAAPPLAPRGRRRARRRARRGGRRAARLLRLRLADGGGRPQKGRAQV